MTELLEITPNAEVTFLERDAIEHVQATGELSMSTIGCDPYTGGKGWGTQEPYPPPSYPGPYKAPEPTVDQIAYNYARKALEYEDLRDMYLSWGPEFAQSAADMEQDRQAMVDKVIAVTTVSDEV